MPISLQFNAAGFERFTATLARFSDNISDAEPAFQKMADFAGTIFAAQFATRGARMGTKWAPLSPNYAPIKERKYPGMPLMVATGDLRSSLAARPFGIDEVTSKGMVVGTGVPYAKYHQTGGGNLPARPLIGRINPSDRARMVKILQAHIVKGTGE